MRDEVRTEWLRVACLLWAGATGQEARYLKGNFTKIARAIEGDIDAAGGDWTREVSASLSRRWGDVAADARVTAVGYTYARKVRPLRAAWSLVSGRPWEVTRGERERVAELLARGVDALRRQADGEVRAGRGAATAARALLDGPMYEGAFADLPEVVEPEPVGDVVAYDFRVARRLGTRTNLRVAADDAPVVARFATAEGGTIGLRNVDGAFFRPVLSPGSWRPATLGRFLEAAASGEPWVDAPYVTAPKGRGAFEDDHAPMHVDAVTVEAPPGRTAARLDDEALALCAATAGRLLLIDGVVHRACPAPTIVPVLIQGERRSGATAHRPVRTVLAWAVGDLHRFSSQYTVAPPGGVCVALDHGNGPDVTWPDVPIGSDEVASRLLRAHVEAWERGGRTSATFDVDTPCGAEVTGDVGASSARSLAALAAWAPLPPKEGRPDPVARSLSKLHDAALARLDDGEPDEEDLDFLGDLAERARATVTGEHFCYTRTPNHLALAGMIDVHVDAVRRERSPGLGTDEDVVASLSL